MAHELVCEGCHEALPAWQAVIRSVSLEQRAWHKRCFGATVIPAARPVNSDLMERLGKAS